VLPPLPYDDPSVTVTSPRSEYTPQTPVLGDPASPVQYPASAPATPAAWGKHLDSGSRFSRQRPKHRLSADIDQLLSQMNEIDFGEEDSNDASNQVDSSEEGSSGSSSRPVRQASFAPLSSVSEDSSSRRTELSEPRKDYPKSMDLSLLGGLMTMYVVSR
jgi:hypothetical protein